MKYRVYLVGAGPGDPGLITKKGLEVLGQADAVIYDYLVDRRILDYTKKGAELISCEKLGKGRRFNGSSASQKRINSAIIKKVNEGKKVVRLKNGDPTIFGRTSQELDALVKEEIEFEIVPGVTAANAASSLSGVPLTDRSIASSCVFVTGAQDPDKKESLLDWDYLSKCGTVVLYMAVGNIEDIVNRMLKAGKRKDTPCIAIKDVSLLTQRLLRGTLKDIAKKAEGKITPPAVIIIGEVARLERDFNWLRKAKKVLFTGLSKERYFTKDIYFHLPMINIVPMNSYREFDNYLRRIKVFDWIVFASRYGVLYFFRRLNSIGYDSRILSSIKIAAIGNSTKIELLDFGIIADLVPEEESSKGLLKEFKKIDLKKRRIFLPRSDISDKGLHNRLEALGADVITGYAYRNVMPKGLPHLDLGFFDEIMFTSPSTVRNFVKRYKRIPKNLKVRWIGDVTKDEAKKEGLI